MFSREKTIRGAREGGRETALIDEESPGEHHRDEGHRNLGDYHIFDWI